MFVHQRNSLKSICVIEKALKSALIIRMCVIFIRNVTTMKMKKTHCISAVSFLFPFYIVFTRIIY